MRCDLASKTEPVIIRGIIRGNGYVTGCRVRAMKINVPGTSTVTNFDFSIEKISRKLPDGSYELLLVNDDVIPMERQNGCWLSL